MITLSKSITNDKPNDVYAVYNGCRMRTNFTHPGDAEADDKQVYKAYIIERMQAKHTSVYKELIQLAIEHKRGGRVVIVTHENTHHGEIIIAAIKYLADKYLVPAQRGTAPHAGLNTWQENAADHDLIDERRFVWVTSRSGLLTRLAYVWDVEGVVTALIPSFGLVKLGRLARPFWYQRRLGHIGPRLHAARVTLERKVERTFAVMIKHQIGLEHIEPLRVTYPFNKRRTDEESWQHQPWDLREEEEAFEEDPTAEEEAAALETEAFFNLYATLRVPYGRDQFALYEPTKFTGEHVKPVIKTKPDGSKWVLTPEMQARGALHLYQPYATGAKPTMIRVVNINHTTPGAKVVYCGRRNVSHNLPESPLANPFPLKSDTPEERDRVIAQFAARFHSQVQDGNAAVADELARLLALSATGDLELACWCAPRRCHCEIIKQFLEETIKA